MAWVKIEADAMLHPKFQAVGSDATVMWLAMAGYCAKWRTDGEVPVDQLVRLAPKGKKWRPLLKKLVDVGLVDPEHDCYGMDKHGLEEGLSEGSTEGLYNSVIGRCVHVHDYLDYNPSAEQERERLERKSAGGKASAKARQSDTDAPDKVVLVHGMTRDSDNSCSTVPVPVPVPVKVKDTEQPPLPPQDNSQTSIEVVGGRATLSTEEMPTLYGLEQVRNQGHGLMGQDAHEIEQFIDSSIRALTYLGLEDFTSVETLPQALDGWYHADDRPPVVEMEDARRQATKMLNNGYEPGEILFLFCGANTVSPRAIELFRKRFKRADMPGFPRAPKPSVSTLAKQRRAERKSRGRLDAIEVDGAIVPPPTGVPVRANVIEARETHGA